LVFSPGILESSLAIWRQKGVGNGGQGAWRGVSGGNYVRFKKGGRKVATTEREIKTS